MHFDDRLGTVLRLRADGAALQRVQLRQLLDLLGTLPAEARSDQIDAAFVRLGNLAKAIPPGERAAMLRDTGLRLRSPRLVAALAAMEPDVAHAALTRAQLGEEQWIDLIPALPASARGHIRARHNLPASISDLLARLGVHGHGLPPAVAGVMAFPEATESARAAPAPEADAEVLPPVAATIDDDAGQGIGAIVRRIEAYRRAREVVEARPHGDSPRLPLGEDHLLRVSASIQACDFATDAAGRIVWADPGAAPMLVGLRLGGRDDASPLSAPPALDEALRRRQPLRALQVSLAGAPAIAGDWQIDAGPWFDPLSGRHLGYRGRLRRPASHAPAAAIPASKRDSEADRIRQMLHELRTPVNAIQGFAEVIQQQLFGPTPHEYRALASTIVGDAARMLAAFEELERLAKLESGSLDIEGGSIDLAEVVDGTAAQLAAHTRQRGSGFVIKPADGALPVAIARIEAERIIWRLLATLAGVAAPGEQLKLRLRERHGAARLDVALPAALASRSGDELFRAAAGSVPQVISAGVFGVGFALRLARSEARAAGGDLLRKDDRLRLVLPGLTDAAAGHSHMTHEG